MAEIANLKPGDFRLFRGGKKRSMVVAVGVWGYRKKEGSPIHIHITGLSQKHTTVTGRPGSGRYHRTLFRDLRSLLIKHGRWPFPPNAT